MDYEALQEWLENLRQSSKLIIVEGINDKKALEEVGAKRIITLKKALFEVVEEIAKQEKEVVILTDLDKKGQEFYGKLKKGLEERGVKIDSYFREFLFKNTELRHIEGLVHYLKKFGL